MTKIRKDELVPLTKEKVLEALRVPQPTCILFHARPDADAIGSAFALSLLLKELGSPTYCLCADEVPERLRFLTKGLQESVLPETLPPGFTNARFVTVDSGSPSQLGRLFDLFGDRISMMIDHHGRGSTYADYWVEPTASATGELIFDLVEAAEVAVPQRCRELMYAAISADTGGFRYSNVTAGTHRRAAALLESGLDAARINHLLLETKAPEVMAVERAAMGRLHFYEGGRIAIVTFPYRLKKRLGVADEHMETVIDVARSVAGVEIAVAIRQPKKENTYRVSMRSAVDFDVSLVCASFGGGGHVRAAGATLQGVGSLKKAEAAVLSAILKVMKES